MSGGDRDPLHTTYPGRRQRQTHIESEGMHPIRTLCPDQRLLGSASKVTSSLLSAPSRQSSKATRGSWQLPSNTLCSTFMPEAPAAICIHRANEETICNVSCPSAACGLEAPQPVHNRLSNSNIQSSYQVKRSWGRTAFFEAAGCASIQRSCSPPPDIRQNPIAM